MKRQFRYNRSMLNGHPGNVTSPVRRVIVRIVNHGLIVTSTTDGIHAPTSFHFSRPGRAVDAGNRVPGTPEARARLVRLQRHLIKKFGCDAFVELFGPDNSLACKNQRRMTLDEGTTLERAHDNHDHIVPAELLPLPALSRRALNRLARLNRRRRARRAGARYTRRIFKFARKHDISEALALALVEKESAFINQYGHDRDSHRNIIWHGKSGLVRVTAQNIGDYLKFARKSGLPQGVGLTQLTSRGLQEEAVRRGGLHLPGPQLDVGFETLAGHIKALGTFRGIGAYNGGRGNPQADYALSVIKLRDKWNNILRG